MRMYVCQFLRLFLYKGVCYLASPLVAKCWTRLNGKSHLVSSSEEGVEFVRDRLHLLEVCCLLSFPAIRNQTGDRYCGVSAAHRTRERKIALPTPHAHDGCYAGSSCRDSYFSVPRCTQIYAQPCRPPPPCLAAPSAVPANPTA